MTERRKNHTEANVRAILDSMAHDPRFLSGELEEVAGFIAETASHVLHCQRTSIWLYEETDVRKYIHCITLFDQNDGFSSGAVLNESDAVSYLNALNSESLIIIDDVASDPRCIELNEDYLPTHNICSMLDAPFQYNGKLCGVVCCEQVGTTRHWTVSEQHFAANMASLMAIALERNNRRETEQELREHEHRYRTLLEDLAVGYCVVVDNIIVFTNKAADEIGAKAGQKLLGRNVQDFLPARSAEKLVEHARNYHDNNLRATDVQEFISTTGRRFVLEITLSPIHWSGQPAIQTLFRDITEAESVRSRIQDSERLLSRAEKIARMGSWVHHLKTDRFECSRALAELIGIDPEESQPLLNRVHVEDRPRLEATQASARASGHAYHITYRIETDNGMLWLEEHGAPERDEDGNVIRIHGSSRDVTRQKLAELEAMATEERFSALGETFPGGFTYCDLSSRFIYINRTFADWFDIDPGDYFGKPMVSLLGESYWKLIENQITSVLKGNSVDFELDTKGAIAEIEYMRITLAPDVSAGGDMHGFFVLVTDTTDVKSMEMMLRQTQRMDALGQLTGGIAHDFNNILAILMGNLELALARSSSESRDYINAALQGVERGVALSQKLLGFARSSTVGSRQVALNKVVRRMTHIFNQSVGSKIEVTIETDDDLWPIHIDPGDFEDAMINLCTNARDAMPTGGQLLVRTSNRTLDETSRRIHPSLKPGDYVLVSVSDTGSGMDLKTRDRLFEPFYTTKDEGKGTGLGMSMVFGFVKRSRGQVVVYSAEGEGSTVNIYLPRYTEIAVKKPEPPQISGAQTSNELVLIVDDEPLVADVAAGILSELGYSTRIASNTTDALNVIREEKPALLFSDVVMPGDLNGFQLAEQAAEIQPSLKVLLTSGFNKYSTTDQNASKLEADILTKPYNRQELAISVRKALQAV